MIESIGEQERGKLSKDKHNNGEQKKKKEREKTV